MAVHEKEEEEELVHVQSGRYCTQDAICPISQVLMKKPMTKLVIYINNPSPQCRHSYDENSILSIMGKKSYIACPVTGCAARVLLTLCSP